MYPKLNCKKIDKKTGIRYPTKKEIASFANRLLNDYCKKFNKDIDAINYYEFVSKYLKIDIQYQKLSLDKSILGATIQKDGQIVTYSYDGNVKIINVKKGDIFIDSDACGCEERELLTIFHEVKHYLEDLDKDFKVDKILDNRSIIDGKFPVHSEYAWAEYYANYFAICILLPLRRLKKLYNEFHFEHLTKYRTNLNGSNIKYLRLIIKKISDKTCASQSAIALRLKETRLISEQTFARLDYKYGKEAVLLFRLNSKERKKK